MRQLEEFLLTSPAVDIEITGTRSRSLIDTAEFEKNIGDAEIVVTTPFHPARMTRERMDKAKKLKLVLTAGIGSDHVDLHAAADNNLTVAEVQGAP